MYMDVVPMKMVIVLMTRMPMLATTTTTSTTTMTAIVPQNTDRKGCRMSAAAMINLPSWMLASL